jgi:effector-binding domain-containing protein
MTMSAIQVADLPAINLAVVRRTVTRAQLSDAVRDGCGRAWAYAKRLGLHGGHNVAVYWDGAIRLESGVELAAVFPEGNGIVGSSTPAGLTAFADHLGPYQQLGAVHAAIRAWCSANGLERAGPNWEIYGHWQAEWNAAPERIETRVCYLVKERARRG